jgi:hypothetical protein
MVVRFNGRAALSLGFESKAGWQCEDWALRVLKRRPAYTVINVGMLVAIGYDPALVPGRIQVTTGSSIEFAPRVAIERIEVLGRERIAFPVLAHTLPPSAGVDGLLGLDFLRGQILTIDFSSGRIMLA